jgi:hypothetical protein
MLLRHHRFAFSFLISTLLLLPPVIAQEEETEYQKAERAWHEQKYSEALPYFRRDASENPQSMGAQDNLAKLYVNMKRYDDAAALYQRMASLAPDQKQAEDCRRMVRQLQELKLHGGTGGGSGSGGYGHAAGGTAGTDGTYGRASSSAQSTAAFSSQMDRMIEIVRPLAGRPQVSSSMIGTVRSALTHVPKSALAAVAEYGIKIVITPTLIDHNPELKNREGRGYDGHTLRLCPGMFDGRHLIVCENTMSEEDESVIDPIDKSDVFETTLHEFGHAFDYCKGQFSESEDFKHAYLLDYARVPAEDRQALAYFMQKSAAGQHEACAELISVVLGGRPRHASLLSKDFPLTISYLQRQLGR